MDLDGPVHYVDHGGPAGSPLLVCVHGLGGSHANWAALAPLLTRDYRVLALDLAGFGLTAGGTRSATVQGNQELLHRFLTELAAGPAVLVGNSMGGMITALQAAEHPESVSALALIDPVLPLALAVPDRLMLGAFLQSLSPMLPGPLRRRLRTRPPLSQAEAELELLTLCCGDPSRVDPDIIEQHANLALTRSVPNAQADFMLAARSLVLTFVRRRSYAALLASLRMPVLLIHGTADRLVPFRVAKVAARANPSWHFDVATGVGHVPMLEAPRWTAARLRSWLPQVSPHQTTP
jgi:pimeloyl-ACP methyl ester carboxylesterase